MDKQYEITTINELVQTAIQTNNIDDLLQDLRTYIDICIEVTNLTNTIVPHKFIWIDDGKHNATIKIIHE